MPTCTAPTSVQQNSQLRRPWESGAGRARDDWCRSARQDRRGRFPTRLVDRAHKRSPWPADVSARDPGVGTAYHTRARTHAPPVHSAGFARPVCRVRRVVCRVFPLQPWTTRRSALARVALADHCPGRVRSLAGSGPSTGRGSPRVALCIARVGSIAVGDQHALKGLGQGVVDMLSTPGRTEREADLIGVAV
jgi:hypothetical protein